MSRVKSSYIPSFKALAYDRETEPNESTGTKMLQVTMPPPLATRGNWISAMK